MASTCPTGSWCARRSSRRKGRAYLAAMRCAANYAFANRQVLAHYARQAFEEVLAGKVKNWHLHQVYDIAHNMGKIETARDRWRADEGVRAPQRGDARLWAGLRRACRKSTSASGSRCWCRAAWAPPPGCWWARRPAWSARSAPSCHGAGRVMSRAKAKKKCAARSCATQLEAQGHPRARRLAGRAGRRSPRGLQGCR